MAQMLFGLPDNLPALVESTYNTAKSKGEVIFAASEATVISTRSGLPFQLRFCPSLAKKPTAKHDEATPKRKPQFNPFENPDPALVIAHLPPSNPSHSLVLNKFPIIPEHFMLITKSRKEQTHMLEVDDLAAVHACLRTWKGEAPNGRTRRLFAFFNSGKNSGASQPHRHVQFLPTESMYEGLGGKEWDLLIDHLDNGKAEPKVPFQYWRASIPNEPTDAHIHEIYQGLYDKASKSVKDYVSSSPGQLELHDTTSGSSAFSYNIAMTTTAMMLCPRRSEGTMLRHQDGSDVGYIALNGTTFGGSMMVKYPQEWDFLRSQSGAMDMVLESIGIPNEGAREDKIDSNRL